jgi:hypothetical protein
MEVGGTVPEVPPNGKRTGCEVSPSLPDLFIRLLQFTGKRRD